MTTEYGSSESFLSRVRYKSIGNNKYTGRISYFCLETTPIDVTVQRYDSNYSYTRSHSSKLSQSVANKLVHCLTQKLSYDFRIIYLVINLFSPIVVRSHLHMCCHSIVTFGIREFCLRLFNTSHVDISDGFRKSVVDQVKSNVGI